MMTGVSDVHSCHQSIEGHKTKMNKEKEHHTPTDTDTDEAAMAGENAAGETTMEDLLNEQASFRQRLGGKEIVWVKVVQIQEKGVMVDIGEKHEGVIPAADFDGELPAVG